MISETLLALGPWIMPIFLLMFTALLCLALYLIDRGGVFCTSIAILILAALGLQLAPLVFVL